MNTASYETNGNIESLTFQIKKKKKKKNAEIQKKKKNVAKSLVRFFLFW